MKKNKTPMLILSILVIVVCLISSCKGEDDNIKNARADDRVREAKDHSVLEQSNADIGKMVRVDNQTYLCMGYVNRAVTCGTPDGKILTSVDKTKEPKKNNESNFGIGYEYQYWDKGYLNVKIGDEWILFQNIDMDSWNIPEGVANFTAEVVGIKDRQLLVSKIDVPSDFVWLFERKFGKTDKKAWNHKPIALPIEKLMNSKDGKEINVDVWLNKRVKVWFDGILKNTEIEMSYPSELGEVYKIELMENTKK